MISFILRAVLRALFWPIAFAISLGYFVRHALHNPEYYGTSGHKLIFEKLALCSMGLLCAGAGVWFATLKYLKPDIIVQVAITMAVYVILTGVLMRFNQLRHFAFDQKLWWFAFPTALCTPLVLFTTWSFMGAWKPDQQQVVQIVLYGLLAIGFIYGAFVKGYAPPKQVGKQVIRKAM